ncbi:hypothetical protein N7512_002318 [Penicillium capsulatum]|nr:hypothetical protein N7512_002318 [Penicillium capsulatum]
MSNVNPLKGVYFPSLKQIPAWNVLEATLHANSIFLKEPRPSHVELQASALIAGSNTVSEPHLELESVHPTGHIRQKVLVLVVSPSSLNRFNRMTTTVKVQAFVRDNVNHAALIAFLCQDGNSGQGLMDLNQLLIPILPKWVPVLHVLEPRDLLADIQDFVNQQMDGTPPMELEQYCYPFTLLSRHANIEDIPTSALALESVFPTMWELSQGFRKEESKDLLRAFLRNGETESIAQFMLQDARVD